jgi:S1-C subfamily serine protease/tetratricopeptide (TPR) repeat protein
VHPAVWVSTGIGIIAGAWVLADVFGLLDPRTPLSASAPSQSTAPPAPVVTDTPGTKGTDWVNELWGHPRSRPTAESRIQRRGTPTGDKATPRAPSIETQESAKSTGKPTDSGAPESLPEQLSAEDLYDRVAPSVVTIIVKDEDGQHIATGSGFFVDSDTFNGRYSAIEMDKGAAMWSSQNGFPVQAVYVLTNYHLIRPAVSADIVLQNGEKGYVNEVIAENAKDDLALLSAFMPANESLAGVPLASENPRVGATVYAIGSPVGLTTSLSEGIVSGFRKFNEGGPWLQTTAPISHGSSGGPLVLSNGRVIGITTFTRDGAQNVNFAIPATTIQTFLVTQYRPRDIAEGASIRWHEKSVFNHLTLELKMDASSQYSSSERNGGKLLESAQQETIAGLLEKPGQDDEYEHYERAIVLAQQAEKSLPDRFKYFPQFMVGRLSIFLAERMANSSSTVQEYQARYRASDHAKNALRYLVKVMNSQPDFAPAFELVVAHYKAAGNWPDALVASDALVELMPRCARALQLRAECYYELQQSESARDDLLAAIELAPRNGKLHSDLASTYTELRDYDKAIASYEQAIAMRYLPFMMHYNMGITYKAAGDFEKAISQFTQAKALGWSTIECDRQIAKCRLRQR